MAYDNIIRCEFGEDMYDVISSYHKKFNEVTKGLKEKYPNTVDGYYDPEYLRALLPYLPVPGDQAVGTWLHYMSWGFEPDYTRAPYYAPKLVAAYDKSYSPEESNMLINFHSELTWLDFVEQQLCPSAFVTAVLKYYDEHGEYYKPDICVDAVDAIGLPDEYAGDFQFRFYYSDYAVSKYKARQAEKERAAKEAESLEAAATLKNRAWSYGKEPSLIEAASLMECVSFATRSPAFYEDLRQSTNRDALIERLYNMIKESYEMLLACGFSYEDPLPELDYGSLRTLWSSLNRASMVCFDAVQTAMDESSFSLEHMKLV